MHYDIKLKRAGARPTNDISIEFETRPKFAVLWFKTYSTDHNEILHMSRQCNCREAWKHFVVIGYVYFKLEYSKLWSNFEFDRNVSGTDARYGPRQSRRGFHALNRNYRCVTYYNWQCSFSLMSLWKRLPALIRISIPTTVRISMDKNNWWNCEPIYTCANPHWTLQKEE